MKPARASIYSTSAACLPAPSHGRGLAAISNLIAGVGWGASTFGIGVSVSSSRDGDATFHSLLLQPSD